MNKSQLNKTIPINISRQISDTSGSNLLTQTHPSPKLTVSQSLLRFNMRKNSWRQNSSTMKSCLKDLKWLFQQCQQFLNHLSNKESIKPHKLRFDNLIKELRNLEFRFQSINISDILDFVNKQDDNITLESGRKFFKPMNRKHPKIDIQGQVTLPLNYNILLDTKTQKHLRNRSQNPSNQTHIISNKQNNNNFQSFKQQNNDLKQLLLFSKKSQSKMLSTITQSLNKIKQNNLDNSQSPSQLNKIDTLLNSFMDYQKQLNKIIDNIGTIKPSSHQQLQQENSKLMVIIEEMKLENQILTAQKASNNKQNIIETENENENSFEPHYMLLLQAQAIEQLIK